MIISGGENVHPVQVEGALGEHPGVVDSIVVSVPDEEWGELVVAYVARRPGGLPEDEAAAIAELDEFLGRHPLLSRYKRPRLYAFVEASEIPFNATGKKLHYRQKAQAAEDHAAGRLTRV